MWKLVMNENMKVFAKKGSWVMLMVVIAITLFSGIYRANTLPASPEEWKAQYRSEIYAAQEALKTPMIPEYQKKELEKTIESNQYKLDHGIIPQVNTWEQVQEDAAVVSLITMFTAAIAGGIVASEFNKGTIKLLLIRPMRRSKILLSKYLAVMSFGFIGVVVVGAVSFLINSILFGFSGSFQGITNTIQIFGLKSLQIVMYATIAFMLSVISRNAALAVGISLVTIILGPQVTSAFSAYPWAKYLVFAHTDPSLLFAGNLFGVSVVFSASIWVLYFMLFNLISWISFEKRDIVV